MIAQAAAIQNRLTEVGGLPEPVVHRWWRLGRRELGGLSPADCVELVGPRAGAALLELAERDAIDLQRDAAGAGVPAAHHIEPYDEGRASTCLSPEP